LAWDLDLKDSTPRWPGHPLQCGIVVPRPKYSGRQWVINVDFTMSALCRLHLRIRTYRCAAANRRNGP